MARHRWSSGGLSSMSTFATHAGNRDRDATDENPDAISRPRATRRDPLTTVADAAELSHPRRTGRPGDNEKANFSPWNSAGTSSSEIPAPPRNIHSVAGAGGAFTVLEIEDRADAPGARRICIAQRRCSFHRAEMSTPRRFDHRDPPGGDLA